MIKKRILSCYIHILWKDTEVSFFLQKDNTRHDSRTQETRKNKDSLRVHHQWTALKGDRLLRSAEDRRFWRGRCDTWGQLHVIHPQSLTDVFKYFARRIIPCWNTFPAYDKDFRCVSSFKRRLYRNDLSRFTLCS